MMIEGDPEIMALEEEILADDVDQLQSNSSAKSILEEGQIMNFENLSQEDIDLKIESKSDLLS